MARNLLVILAICYIQLGLSCASGCNIFDQKAINYGCEFSLKNYCESWRMNVELHNIRDFDVVPEECVEYMGKYMTSMQYKVDSERTIDECRVYVSTSCAFKKDGADAWIFDVDDTLLSTVPYYRKNGFGGVKLNLTSMEEWMKKGQAMALEHSLMFFNELKGLGVKIILISSRRESLRSATVDNLVSAGFYGWKTLILRGAEDEKKEIDSFKADVRKQLMSSGYRIWGILGDQWSSIQGPPTAQRAFKLPNPLYYVA
ncbi:acid phosphatase 1-like [Salvia divinorum]|uniref:Acid phosphatase 1-like n=1 Tax=Salvia divinorum TaxID=28513 RepID=A0ABD1FWD1_SALDI